MFRGREGAEKTPEYYLEAAPRFRWWQVCHGWLFADHEFELGDQVDHQLAVRTQRVQNGLPPMINFGFAFDQDLTHQHLECLCQRCVWYVALVLVELARGKKPAWWDQHFVQFVNDGRLANAGIPRYQHDFGGTLHHHPVKRREQSVDLALPAVQFFGYQQSV